MVWGQHIRERRSDISDKDNNVSKLGTPISFNLASSHLMFKRKHFINTISHMRSEIQSHTALNIQTERETQDGCLQILRNNCRRVSWRSLRR